MGESPARDSLRRFLRELVACGTVSAAAAVVGDARSISCEAATGSKRRDGGGRMTTSSLFDLASLTKPVMATLAQTLDADRTLPLRRSVAWAAARCTPALTAAPALGRKSLGSLLRHRSGLDPWAPLFALETTPVEAVSRVFTDPLRLGSPPGTYSDLGYILWGGLAQGVAGRSLAQLVRDRVARPLALARLSGPPGESGAAVECRLDNLRERELAASQGVRIPRRGRPRRGTVQDGNARFLGPSGHAGLFGSARAIWRLAAEWAEPRLVLEPAGVASALAGAGGYALGWRRRPPETRGRTGLWYGHVGFTGGGVWFCAETGEVRVLLAHRASVAVRMDDWRRRFLELPA